jgi:hypothetical protein
MRPLLRLRELRETPSVAQLMGFSFGFGLNTKWPGVFNRMIQGFRPGLICYLVNQAQILRSSPGFGSANWIGRLIL